MTFLLFIIAILHGLVFATAQEPLRFVSVDACRVLEIYRGMITAALYFSGIIVALTIQWFSRIFGIKSIFVAGLASSFIGMAFFYATHLVNPGSGVSFLFLVCGMVMIGAAVSSVAIVLATYVVIEFPKKIAMGLVFLYSCLNAGIMISGPTFDYFERIGAQGLYLIVLALSMAFFIWLIRRYFVAPYIPRHLEKLRKGSPLWKELRYRMGIFVFSMVLYGLLENTFNINGRDYLRTIFPHGIADKIIFSFWLTLTLGQIGIGIPSFWILPSKVVRVLPIFIILGLFLIPLQTDFSGYLLTFMIGGIGCSAVFPLLLAMLMLEMRHVNEEQVSHTEMAPYFEAGCGYMVASYMLGIGLVALQANFNSVLTHGALVFNFSVGIGFASLFLILILFLNRRK